MKKIIARVLLSLTKAFKLPDLVADLEKTIDNL
jgi:hypothetical protein